MSPPNDPFFLTFFIFLIRFLVLSGTVFLPHIPRATRVLPVAFISGAKVKVGQNLFENSLFNIFKHFTLFVQIIFILHVINECPKICENVEIFTTKTIM